MALIFNDTFTGTVGTLLDAHPPDTGTSWTKILLVGGGDFDLSGGTGLLRFTNAGIGLNEGALYTADATYSTADYKVTVVLTNLDSSDDTMHLAVRVQDSTNMYALRLSTSIFELYKCVAGVWSVIGTDLGAVAGTTDTVELEAVGTSIKTYINSVAQHSVTDSSISGAGEAGVGSGAIIVSTDDGAASARPTSFQVNSVVPPTTTSTSSTSSSISTSSTSRSTSTSQSTSTSTSSTSVSTSSTSSSTSVSTSTSISTSISSTSQSTSVSTSTSSTSTSRSTSTSSTSSSISTSSTSTSISTSVSTSTSISSTSISTTVSITTSTSSTSSSISTSSTSSSTSTSYSFTTSTSSTSSSISTSSTSASTSTTLPPNPQIWPRVTIKQRMR